MSVMTGVHLFETGKPMNSPPYKLVSPLKLQKQFQNLLNAVTLLTPIPLTP